jgi:hypothetical protein
MSEDGLTPEELQAETAVALPDKEVVSILDLNVDVDVLLDAASPIDLAAAAQLNVAAALDAAAGASVLAFDSTSYAEVVQDAQIDQLLQANAHAQSDQVSDISQGDEAEPPPPPAEDGETAELGLFEGPLLNVDVDVDVDADLAAPIAGAVAANANVAAPIAASVGANVITWNSDSIAVSAQTAVINQTLQGNTEAFSDQDSAIDQATTQPATVVGSTSRLGELGGTATTSSGDSSSDSTAGTTASTSDSSSSGDSSSTGTTSSGSTSSSSGSTSGSSSSSGSGT